MAPTVTRRLQLSGQRIRRGSLAVAGEGALRVELGKRGYAFAEIAEPDIFVDHATHTAALVLRVDPNGVREFGRIVLELRRQLHDHLVLIVRRVDL